MTNIVRVTAMATGLAAGVVLLGNAVAAQERWPERPLSSTEAVAEPRRGALTEDELAMARTAWVYFVNNTQPGTGLVNAVDGFPSTTLWDTASALAAIVSAQELGLIDAAEGTARVTAIVKQLAGIDLFRQDCPNKVYDTRLALPTNYANEIGEIGCSALDIGRLMVWLRIVEQRYPELAPKVQRTLIRWNWCRLLEGRQLNGVVLTPEGTVSYLQEGRLGYEEYAARAYALWGFDASEALRPEPFDTLTMYGVEIPFDSRDPLLLGASNFVVTESYALWGLEYGWADPEGTDDAAWIARAAQNIYEVQSRRHDATGILTARTEHQLATEPYFVYDTVFANGRPWATLTTEGAPQPEGAAVALKGALGLWALWETGYTDQLFDYIAPQFDPEAGFHEGVFEDGRGAIEVQTANNNGIMLETLLYKVEGPLLRPLEDPADWTAGLAPEQGRCLPIPASAAEEAGPLPDPAEATPGAAAD